MAKAPLPYSKLGSGFTFPEYSPVYPRDPGYKLHHYRLEIRVYVEEGRIEGKATLRVSRAAGEARSIEIDAVDMEIRAVSVNGRGVDYTYDGEKLVVRLPEPLGEAPVDVTVEYSVEKPRYGLYFVGPSEHYPNKRYEVWSQGETEWNRYWMPIYDYPNNKATSEMIVWVPRGYMAISNGSLAERRSEGDWEVYHWVFDKPHSTYLIALAVGKYVELKEKAGDVTLYYYVPPGREGDAPRSFSRTKDMIRFFEEYLGVKYPYDNYKQVCVQDFVVGGMENTSMTILLEETLHDEHAHMDYESEGLVAHELAHQWFGDLVTCRDWGHIWINESFATYMEALYRRHWKGGDEFVYRLVQMLDSYLDEARRNYTRPIVYNVYKYSEEVFDAHSYPKGALVLHTLANLLGEDTFRRGLKEFLTRFAYKNADTEDFKKVMSEISGRNLDWFFNQYVYNAGHPVVKVSKSWDEDAKILKLELSQTQDTNTAPEAYYLPVEVAVVFEDGSEVRRRVVIEERRQVVQLPLDKRPAEVYVDPEFKVFMVLDVDYPVEDLIRVLERGRYVYWRILAARKLREKRSVRAVKALKKAVLEDRFWGVSYEAAVSLGKLGMEEAMKALIECLEKVENPRVRRGIVKGLGEYRDERAAKALAEVLSNPRESYYVRAEAATSLGRTKVPWALDVLKRHLDTPSHWEVITRGVLAGLAELGGDEAKKIIIEYSKPGKNRWVRIAAAQAMGKFPGDKEVLDAMAQLARERDHRIQMAVASAAREMMDPRTLDILKRIVEDPAMPWAYKAARIAERKIREHVEKGVEYKALREEIEKMREESRRLVERIERIEVLEKR